MSKIIEKVKSMFTSDDDEVKLLPVDGLRMISTKNGFKIDPTSLRNNDKFSAQIQAAKKLAGIA